LVKAEWKRAQADNKNRINTNKEENSTNKSNSKYKKRMQKRKKENTYRLDSMVQGRVNPISKDPDQVANRMKVGSERM